MSAAANILFTETKDVLNEACVRVVAISRVRITRSRCMRVSLPTRTGRSTMSGVEIVKVRRWAHRDDDHFRLPMWQMARIKLATAFAWQPATNRRPAERVYSICLVNAQMTKVFADPA